MHLGEGARGQRPRYAEAGILAVDLTPAAVGPYLCPAVNLEFNLDAVNVNMITCGGRATIPMVNAVAQVVPVPYAEIVASVSSKSAGPGTRANIDEFTETTADAVVKVGGAKTRQGDHHPQPGRAADADAQLGLLRRARRGRGARSAAGPHPGVDPPDGRVIQDYVPGYHLRADPQFDHAREQWQGMARAFIPIEVKGRGDYLPDYAGNLDIITAAAARVGDIMVAHRLGWPRPGSPRPTSGASRPGRRRRREGRSLIRHG